MRTFHRSMAVAAVGMGLSVAGAGVFAQQQDQPEQQRQQQQEREAQQQQQQQPMAQMELQSANDLIGIPVRNYQDENLGTIRDIVLDHDARGGQISYVALRFGGWFGVGGDLHAIPFEAFEFDEENDQLLLDATQSELEDAPGFDADNWPDRADPRWQQVDQFYGVEREGEQQMQGGQQDWQNQQHRQNQQYEQGQRGRQQNQQYQHYEQGQQQNQQYGRERSDTRQQYQQRWDSESDAQRRGQYDGDRFGGYYGRERSDDRNVRRRYEERWEQHRGGTQQQYGRESSDRSAPQQYNRGNQQQYEQQRFQDEPLGRERGAQNQQQFDQRQGQANQQYGTQQQMQWSRRLSEIIGTSVENPNGEPLGQVEDIVIDLDRGVAAYSVVSYGGTLGVGEQQSAVPWTAMEVDRQRETLVLQATQDQLEQTPFESVEALADAQQAEQIHQQYQAQPYWEIFAMPRERGAMDPQQLQGWQQLDDQYDAENTQTISGTIETIGTFRPTPDAAPGRRYRVQTEDEDRVVTVYGGPQQFHQQQERRQGVELNRGDEIEVTGSEVEVGRRTVLLAQEITKDGETLTLRDEQGQPEWQTQQTQQQPGQQQRQQGQFQDQGQQQFEQRRDQQRFEQRERQSEQDGPRRQEQRFQQRR